MTPPSPDSRTEASRALVAISDAVDQLDPMLQEVAAAFRHAASGRHLPVFEAYGLAIQAQRLSQQVREATTVARKVAADLSTGGAS